MANAPLIPCDKIIDDFVFLAKERDKKGREALFCRHDGINFAPLAYVLSRTQGDVDPRFDRTLLELECAKESREIARRYEIVRHGMALSAIGRHPSELVERVGELMSDQEKDALLAFRRGEEAVDGRTCGLYDLELKGHLALKGVVLHYVHSMELPIEALVRVMHYLALLRARNTEAMPAHFVSSAKDSCPLAIGVDGVARGDDISRVDGAVYRAIVSLRHGWRMREKVASEGLRLLLADETPARMEMLLDAMLPTI